MGKHKSKYKARSDRFSGSSKTVKENPFEVRINKRRYDILGRKSKHEVGKPGVSRSRGLKKREKTLLVEYKQRNKANTFIDKRFGEYDENLSLEEKMLKRFATEKQKHHEKAGLFNLEDEDLTHFGQSLGDIKQFDNPILSDDESDKEDNEENGYSFGGFLKRKVSIYEKSEDKPKSKKEIMEEVVANAKLRKHERRVVKEESETMRQKLDEGLNSIKGLLHFRAEKEPREKTDDYDKTVREMAFEMKARASDKLKTEEQIARLEEEKLKKLEAERVRRMKGLPVEEKKPTHRSADDLDDGYTVNVDLRSLLTYKDGKMVVPEGYDSDGASMAEDEITQAEENEVAEDGTHENQEDKEGDEEIEGDEEEDSEGEDEEDADDSDILSSDDESLNDDMEVSQSTAPSKPKQSTTSNASIFKSSNTEKNEIPFTFNAPKTYEDFLELIHERSCADVLTIVERIQKCNHPKLNPTNKAKMEVFFSVLVRHIDEESSKKAPNMAVIDGLASHLFNLAQHSPVHAARIMQDKLKDLHKQFCAMSKKRKVPNLQTVLHLRMISLLFPTSDFRHGVCTPALIFMAQILSQITVHTTQDALVGLFVCSLAYEFVRISKRYVPEVINYLTGILYLSSEKTDPLGKVFPPFKTHSRHRDLLRISCHSATTSDQLPEPVSITKIFTSCEQHKGDDSGRVSALWTCLKILGKVVPLYGDLVSFQEIFEPVKYHMKRINISNYSPSVQSLHSDVLISITSHVTQRKPLTLQTRRPIPIQTFEPKFQEHYAVKRKHSSANKVINERQKLRYKHKKEFKGALREIRKDNQFLARQKLQEQLERDAERARKTKEIQSLLSNQQAEANALNRKKRKLRG